MAENEPRRRRVVKRHTKIPSMTDLYHEASKRGMTVQEYIENLNILNKRKRNRA